MADAGATAAACLLVALAVCAGGVRAAESVASNLDLMTRITAEAVAELYGKFGESVQGRSVEIRPYGGSEDYVFVANVFTTELTRRGVDTVRGARPGAPARPQSTGSAAADSARARYVVPEPEAAGPAGDLVLQFQNVAFEVVYPDAYRSHLVGGKKIKRTAGVRIFATLTDSGTGQVIWTGETERSHADEFDKDDALRIESGSYAFLRPPPPASGWGKYVEPVFVSAIVVGLIYLFFSNQSDN